MAADSWCDGCGRQLQGRFRTALRSLVTAILAALLCGLLLHLLVDLVHALVPGALTLLRRVLLLATAVGQLGSPWLRTTLTQRRRRQAVRPPGGCSKHGDRAGSSFQNTNRVTPGQRQSLWRTPLDADQPPQP